MVNMKHQNNRRKICRLFLLLFAICLLSLASCPLPFNSGIDSSTVDTLPPGMGSFSLTVSGTSRTLMPATPELSDFECFELIFNSGSTEAKRVEYDYNGAASLPPVILQPGIYSLTVNAYKGPGKINLAASGELTGIVIEAGKNTPASVILRVLFGTDKGMFKWSIRVPDFVAKGSIGIKRLGSTGETPFDQIIISTNSASSSSELDSGVYNVTFDLRSEDEDKTLKWSEIVYIYSSLDTIFNINFTDEYFNNSNHTVTLQYNNGTEGTQSVLNGGMVDIPDDPVPTARLYDGSVPSTHSSGYEWYGDPDLVGSQWNFDTPIHANTNIYAKWIGGSIDIYGQSKDNDVARAIAYINENAAANKEYTLLVVVDDVAVGPQTISADNFNLTIKGIDEERTIRYNGAASSPLFTINSTTASLTLGNNITLEGIDGGSTSLVRVTSGTLVMEEGSKITGHTNSYNSNDNSNKGGAVRIDTGGTFNMSGGEISGNSTVSDGSGVYIAGGKFTMTGGEISGNTVGNSAAGGGVYFNSGTFTVGGTAKIFSNHRIDGSAYDAHLYCAGDNSDDNRYITLGTGGNAPITEPDGMKIYVSLNEWTLHNGIIVKTGADVDIAKCFYADDNTKEVVRSEGRLFIWAEEMVLVEGGTFTMGSPITELGSDDDEAEHEVTLTKNFYMGKYQVTQALYEAVMGINPSFFKTNKAAGDWQHRRPVENVSWYDALVFCNRLSIAKGLIPAYSIYGSTNPNDWDSGTVPIAINTTWDAVVFDEDSTGYRLPTEAQWEYAARGGKLFEYYKVYSGSDEVGNVAWWGNAAGNVGNSDGKTHEVGKKTANELGIHDMSGNVWEWCWDWYGPYASDETDPMGASDPRPEHHDRVFRGGGFRQPINEVRSACRGKTCNPTYKDNDVGFRVVRAQ